MDSSSDKNISSSSDISNKSSSPSPSSVVNNKNIERASASSNPQKGKPIETPRVVIEHGFVPDLSSKHRAREKRKLAFLDCYYDQMTISHAAAAIGISGRIVYEWQADDRKFARAFDICWQAVTDRLKRVGMSRAIRGSDNLLMFMLKAHDPSYRERIQAELDPKMIDNLVNTLVDSLRKVVPNNCPHCKMNLGLTEKVARMLSNLSQGVSI